MHGFKTARSTAFSGLAIALLLLPARAQDATGGLSGAQAARVPPLGLPIDCTLGTDCFVQQWPDMDAGDGVADPFCGSASYDGHDGVDIRIESMKDVASGTPVVASADGRVRGVRDGMADHLVETPADRAAIEGRECGNGVVISHGDGVETQYCHMRKGSIVVETGDEVKAGQTLGDVGASGLAQFPHVHLSVRVDGRKFDPVSGRALDGGGGCIGPDAMAATMFTPQAAAELPKQSTAILDMGLAGGPVDYDALVIAGAPPAPAAGAPMTLLWGWFINLKEGDVIASTLIDPEGREFFANEAKPLDRNKASYSLFGGRKRPLSAGTWTASLTVLRDGEPVATRERKVEIE